VRSIVFLCIERRLWWNLARFCRAHRHFSHFCGNSLGDLPQLSR
jgi:hypothetical protein